MLAGRLRRYAAQHAAALAQQPAAVDLAVVQQGSTIRDFERSVILPVFGWVGRCGRKKKRRKEKEFEGKRLSKRRRYQSLDEYYTDGSAHLHLPLVRTPTLLLLAKDDPFLGEFGCLGAHPESRVPPLSPDEICATPSPSLPSNL